MAQAPVIVWFRQVMRLADHPALLAALATGQRIVPVFILDDDGKTYPQPIVDHAAARARALAAYEAMRAASG